MEKEIIDLTNEWNEKNGGISAEFSFHENKTKEFGKIVSDQKVIGGKWTHFPCDHCIEYHGAGYRHAEIIKI